MERKRFVLNGRNECDGSPQQFCFDFNIKRYNRHGNIEVFMDKIPSSFVPFCRSTKYVFSPDGVCISHPPSTRYTYFKVNAELVKAHS
jgi:hypothetical protein